MAGTINLANVALGFDASKITRGVDLSAGEMRKLNQIFKESIAPVDRYNADLNILEKAHKTGAISADRMKQSIASLQEKYKQGISAGTGGQSAIAGDLKSTLAQYAGMAAAFGAVKNSLSLAATAESNKISLEVLTGSVAKASMLYEGFIELDRNSPLSRADFSRASQTLIGYGFAAESTLPALKQLSEISIGNAERFQSLSLAFGQVTANGRLMGQEVLQMVNAGFNPLQEISRTTGRSMVELKKAMEDGAISASMVEAALRSATSEGGRFYEMNERLRNSAAGQFAKMQSDVQLLATEIGTNLLPAAKSFMELMNTGANKSGEGGFLAERSKDASVALQYASAVFKDLYSNTLGDGSEQAIAKTFSRLKEEEMTQKMLAEYRHVNTKEENERLAKNRETKAAKERAELEATARRQRETLEENERTQKDAIEKEKKDRDRLSKHFEDIHNKRLREAAELEKATLTPLQEYEKELARINELSMFGAISDDVAKRGKDKAGEKLISQANAAEKKQDPLGISQTIAPALKAGSVEAYKFMQQQNDKLYEESQKLINVSEQTLDVAKQQLTAIQAIPRIGLRRGSV
jgi:tape measure domain-containing protein